MLADISNNYQSYNGLLLLLLSGLAVSDSMQPHRQQPTRLPRPWDSPGKNTGVGCHFLLQRMQVKSQSEVAQSCPILSNPMDRSLQGSSVHGIFQPRVLEWGAIAFSHTMGNWDQTCLCKELDMTENARNSGELVIKLRFV